MCVCVFEGERRQQSTFFSVPVDVAVVVAVIVNLR